MNDILAKRIKNGIPVESVYLQSSVRNVDKQPETNYSIHSNVGSRRAEMWECGDWVIFKQKDSKKNVRYFSTPAANCADVQYLVAEATEEK